MDMKKTDLEIVEALARKQPVDDTARKRLWAKMLDELAPIREAEDTAAARALRHALACAPCMEPVRRAAFPTWRLAMATAALVAFLVGGAVMLAPHLLPREDDTARYARNGTASGVVYVDFAAPEKGSGTLDQPYATLGEALEKLPATPSVLRLSGAHSTETLRIDKPLRIETAGGLVVVGARTPPQRQSPEPITP